MKNTAEREKGYKVRKQVFGSYNRGFKGNV
jgi:hypothetical protein